MVSIRPALRRTSTTTVARHLQHAGRAVRRRLPGNPVHSERTRAALYVVAALQIAVAVLYAYLALHADGSLYLVFLPSTDYLFWIPVVIAVGGIGLTFIALLGSVPAGWLVALVNLPLAMTALYVDGILLSYSVFLLLLITAGWLARNLLNDAAARQPSSEE